LITDISAVSLYTISDNIMNDIFNFIRNDISLNDMEDEITMEYTFMTRENPVNPDSSIISMNRRAIRDEPNTRGLHETSDTEEQSDEQNAEYHNELGEALEAQQTQAQQTQAQQTQTRHTQTRRQQTQAQQTEALQAQQTQTRRQQIQAQARRQYHTPEDNVDDDDDDN
jgi:hypothetical protein